MIKSDQSVLEMVGVSAAELAPPPYVPDVRPHTAAPPGTVVAGEYGLMAGPDWVGAGVRSLG